MTNSQSERSKAARARCATARNEALIAAGYRRLNILLPPESIAELDDLVEIHGTKTAVIKMLLHESSKRT